MPDYKYREAALPDNEVIDGLGALENLKHGPLAESVSVFKTNLDRVQSLLRFPALLCYASQETTVVFVNAVSTLHGPGHFTLDSLYQTAVHPDSLRLFQQGMADLSMRPMEERLQQFEIHGVARVDGIISDDPAGTNERAMQALFQGAVLGAWTAFECLAEDLWPVGVDAAGLEVKNRVLKSLLLLEIEDKKKFSKKLSVEKMGSALAEWGTVGFRSLRTIREAYWLAFGDLSAALYTERQKGEIDGLAAYRNVIAHSHAVADGEFLAQLPEIQEYKRFAYGNPVILDGLLVKRLFLASLRTGTALIEAVASTIPPSQAPTASDAPRNPGETSSRPAQAVPPG